MPHHARRRDEWIRNEVRHHLFEDTWLDARRIRVEVADGVATLSGRVRSYLEARYAWDDAWETPGVRGVISRLEVVEDAGRQALGAAASPGPSPAGPPQESEPS